MYPIRLKVLPKIKSRVASTALNLNCSLHYNIFNFSRRCYFTLQKYLSDSESMWNGTGAVELSSEWEIEDKQSPSDGNRQSSLLSSRIKQ